MPFAPPRPCRNCRKATTEKGGYCETCKPKYEKQRRQTETWRHVTGARGGTIDIYQSSRWKAERKAFLIGRPLCECDECRSRNMVTAATVVHHVKPHRGDPELFWDWNNWSPRAKSCHDRETMREVHERNRHG